MAYDELLSMRFRDVLGDTPQLSEKRMMGGLCFLYQGNMIGGADRSKDGHGRFLFRVGKDREAEALTRAGTAVLVQGGRRMGGFVHVDADACDEALLRDLTGLALDFVKSLPAK